MNGSSTIRGVLLVTMLIVATVGSALAAEPAVRVVDLTFPLADDSIFWPTATPFKLTSVAYGVSAGGWWYASNDFTASEHGGTHADAPIHFARGGRTIDQVPLTEWIGPAVKIDFTAQCAKDRNYLLKVEDITTWEKANGKIPAHAWVVMYTGIDNRFYPDRRQVLGTDKTGPAALPELAFPGFSPAAAEFLVKQRDITGIALDTPSIDNGPSKDFQVHQIICGAGKLALENIAHLDQLPAKGATLYVIPMMIKNGTGAPARVFAMLPGKAQ